MYQQFKEDPNSVDPSWHDLLKNYEPGDNGSGSDTTSGPQSNGSNGAAPETKTAEKKTAEKKTAAPAPQKLPLIHI